LAQPALDRLTALLSAALGRPATIVAAERLAPWSVMRCRLAGAGAPATVIVKWLRDDPNGFRVDPRQIATEQAALEFLAEVGFPAAPRVIGADRAAGVLLIEDLSPLTPLMDRICVEGPDAMEGALFAFASVNGAFGAATAGREAAYDAIRNAYGPVDPLATRARGFGPLWTGAQTRLAALGLDVSAVVERDMAALLTTLDDPDAFLAFTNGDAQVNNFMTDGVGGKLIDFEGAAFRHALVSAVWIHMPGSAWMTVAGARSLRLEDAYRAALAEGVREAVDDRLFGAGMAAACLCEACDRLSRFARLDAREPGDDGRVQMVFTLEAAADVARRHRAFEALAGWCERAGAWLRKRWPDADADVARYRPYTPRTRS
jgi:hypothetical protein